MHEILSLGFLRVVHDRLWLWRCEVCDG